MCPVGWIDHSPMASSTGPSMTPVNAYARMELRCIRRKMPSANFATMSNRPNDSSDCRISPPWVATASSSSEPWMNCRALQSI